jgi:hypothetical protein
VLTVSPPLLWSDCNKLLLGWGEDVLNKDELARFEDDEDDENAAGVA